MIECIGGCGKEAIHGKWCSTSYRKCFGYKKKLSDKAKLRGNNGVKGILSKKYTEDDKIPKEHSLVCFVCHSDFKRVITGESFKRYKNFLCDSCKKEKVSLTMKKRYLEKRKTTPHELLGGWRKLNIWEEQGKKCNSCGFDKYDIKMGPYELHHIDGNSDNHIRENEEILCCNCHAMTDNYKFKYRKHSESSKQKNKESQFKNLNGEVA